MNTQAIDWTTRYNYNFPTLIRFGQGVSDEIGPYLKSEGLSKPLIVTDPLLPTLPFFKEILERLHKEGLNTTVFNSIDKNPVEKNVLDGVRVYHANKCDSVIGLGGGASMDVARAIVLKAFHERDLFDFDDALGGDKYVTGEIPHFVTVPTTSGTGSEVGRSSVISENDTHKKRILFSPRLMAKKVFADPALTLELPPSVTAATGIDALTHNIEAYLSKGFSPLCDGIALEGIRLISESLENAVKNSNIENRSKMMIASLMGATAFQKGLGVVHSLAHPMSTLYDTHHGLANAIMLPHGLKFNKEIVEDRLKSICRTIQIDQNPQNLIYWVNDLNQNIGIPSTLGEININEDGVDKLSELALADVCHQCNPRTVTLDDFKELYRGAL